MIAPLKLTAISLLFALVCWGWLGVARANEVHFANDVVPILTKLGCNSGGCHGKATGQNGFKLSLFGYEPSEDYQHIAMEARGRRITLSAPENSLLLLKATNRVPHHGGERLLAESDEYATLVRWIRQGAQLGSELPSLVRIEVSPSFKTMPASSKQATSVTAYYSDGSSRDVTRLALFDPADKSMSSVTDGGVVTVHDRVGDAGVMIRYQGQVALFRARIPKGNNLVDIADSRNFIDDLVLQKLKALGVPPSNLCDDSTFLRRLTLDLVGRLPTIEECEQFFEDTSSEKRDEAIDRLLASDEYAEYFAGKWSALLRNRREDPSYERGCILFWQWIRDSFAENKPYDQFVRELITASGDIENVPAVAWYRSFKEPHLQMEDMAQLFLGTRLQCAQCHHHPFEKWSQRDYLSLAAYFSRVTHKTLGIGKNPAGNVAEDIVVHRRGEAYLLHKKTQEKIRPAALGSDPGVLSPDDDPRQSLANWMIGDSNPYFARTLVNRYWKHFFGKGIVEPEDDLRETNPPSNPELLDALAHDFVAHRFDMKHLIRTMTRSRIYQTDSEPNGDNVEDQQNFSHYTPKRLPAEVLLDSVNTLTKSSSPFKNMAINTRAAALPDNSFNSGNFFLTVFGRPDSSSACECERTTEASLAQSLHLINADDLQSKLSNNRGRAAEWAQDSRPNSEKIREMYLIGLSRYPTPEESALAEGFLSKKVASAQSDSDRKKGLQQGWEDLLWAMFNTKEFLFNH